MDDALQKGLFDRYPSIFARHDPAAEPAPIQWGIQCGDGWLRIIEALCDVLSAVEVEGASKRIEAVQVKEKFGVMRFYARNASEMQSGMIRMAEAMSARTCEICGSPGVMMNRDGWYKVRCELHSKARRRSLES